MLYSITCCLNIFRNAVTSPISCDNHIKPKPNLYRRSRTLLTQLTRPISVSDFSIKEKKKMGTYLDSYEVNDPSILYICSSMQCRANICHILLTPYNYMHYLTSLRISYRNLLEQLPLGLNMYDSKSQQLSKTWV